MRDISNKTEHFHGLDLLRVLLSFFVVIIHVMHFGGLRDHTTPAEPSFYFLWFIGCALVCSVNCFAIISGYLFYGREFKYTNIVRHFLTVLYHGILITAAFCILVPNAVTRSNWIQALFPISTNEFWYFTSYFCLFFFIPILSQGMQILSKKHANILLIAIIFILSVFTVITNNDVFVINHGFSPLWLAFMFIIGTYLRKYRAEIQIKKHILLMIYLGCVFLSYLGVIISAFVPSSNAILLIEYSAPTTVIAAIAVVLLFDSLPVTSVGKIPNACVPFAFSIYIIHDHPLIRQYFIQDRFITILRQPVPILILSVVGISVLIWCGCFGMEYIKRFIFRLINVDKALQKLEKQIHIWTSNSSD